MSWFHFVLFVLVVVLPTVVAWHRIDRRASERRRLEFGLRRQAGPTPTAEQRFAAVVPADCCGCDTVEEGRRPCPVSLCERSDHWHDDPHDWPDSARCDCSPSDPCADCDPLARL